MMIRLSSLSTFFFLLLSFFWVLGCHSKEENSSVPQEGDSSPSLVVEEVHQAFLQNYLYPKELPSDLSIFESAKEYIAFVNHQRMEEDRFSDYLDPESFERVKAQLFEGQASVGIQFQKNSDVFSETNPLVIEEVLSFSRAYYDGMVSGDRVLEIDGIPVEGMTLVQVQEIFPTLENEGITLKLQRGDLVWEQGTAAENSVDFMINDLEGIAYISLRSFSSQSLALLYGNPHQVTEPGDLGELMLRGATKLILDLRGNTGGSLLGAMELLNFFIPQDGLLLYSLVDTQQQRTNYLTHSFTPRELFFNSTNMVVLVDENSLSASELFVNALKAYGEATIIGTQTGGKGVAQHISTFSDNSAAILVSRLILGPTQEAYHLVGISPDQRVPSLLAPALGEDLPLQSAIQFLSR
jgi:carboxyl-terminal processing protease